MQRFILAACAGLAAAAAALPSAAADLEGPIYSVPPYPSDYIAPFAWTGFYVGINAGYGFGTSNWTNSSGTSGDFPINGALVGGTAGFNWQTGVWVWGLEGDFNAAWLKGSGCGGGFCQTSDTWLGTARGRIGYATGLFMPYITGGAAFGDVRMRPFAATTQSETKVGWTIGAGVEFAVYGAWSLKAEYLYVDLGKTNCSITVCGLVNEVTFTTNIVRGGLNYRF